MVFLPLRPLMLIADVGASALSGPVGAATALVSRPTALDRLNATLEDVRDEVAAMRRGVGRLPFIRRRGGKGPGPAPDGAA